MPTIVYINRAADCTVEQFIACKFDNNIKALVLTGEPTEQQLAEAWDNIETEFIDLSGTMIKELDIMKQIKVLECDIQAINCFLFVQEEWVKQFGMPHMENMAVLNKDYRAGLKWDVTRPDPNAFIKQLQNFKVSVSNKTVKLKEKQKELDKLKAEQIKKPTVNNSKKVFLSTMNEIGKFNGYHLDKKKIMVDEYAVMINDYTEHCKRLEESMSKN